MVIRNRARAKQLLDFSGLERGDMRWVDIDGLIDCGGGWLVVEVKYNHKQLHPAHRITLQRLINDLSKVKSAVCAVVNHFVDDTNIDPIIGDCEVVEYYYEGEWKPTNKPTTLNEFEDNFFRKIEE